MLDLLRDELQSALGDAYTLQRELSGSGMSRVLWRAISDSAARSSSRYCQRSWRTTFRSSDSSARSRSSRRFRSRTLPRERSGASAAVGGRGTYCPGFSHERPSQHCYAEVAEQTQPLDRRWRAVGNSRRRRFRAYARLVHGRWRGCRVPTASVHFNGVSERRSGARSYPPRPTARCARCEGRRLIA